MSPLRSFSLLLPIQHHPSSPLLSLTHFHAFPRGLQAMPPCVSPPSPAHGRAQLRKRRAEDGLGHDGSAAVTPPWLLGEIPAPVGCGGWAQTESSRRAQELGSGAVRRTRE